MAFAIFIVSRPQTYSLYMIEKHFYDHFKNVEKNTAFVKK